ncbi:hypothetical protein N9934_05195 [Desulfosarcina sp.]|nr:hypothetical protein [Desulfosarcina sp.]
MKKIKIALLSSFVLLGLITSCEDNVVIYDPATGQTLAFFTETSSDLPVLINESTTVELELGVSTLSASDRTVVISIDPSSTAAAENYDIPSSAVIPANEYFGTISVTGVDNTVETTAETIILNIGTVEGTEVAGNATHTLSIFQVCPVAETAFTGDYLIEQTSPFIDGPTLQDGDVITIVNDGGTARSFLTSRYVLYCGTPMPFEFTLVCNSLIVPFQNTNCSCGNVVDWFGPADVPESYDPNDDSVFFLTFKDDIQSDCGPTAETTYKFTKQ